MEWLTGDLLDKLTAPSLLLLFFLLNMLGLIRPKRAVDEIRADRDDRLAEAYRQVDMWHDAYDNERKARETQGEVVRTQGEALRESLEVARAANDALRGFRAASLWIAEHQQRGGTDEVATVEKST
jgi:hypothetical protein